MNSLYAILTMLFFMVQFTITAQTDNAFRTISGDQVLIKNNNATEGDPYLFKAWSNAIIIDRNGNELSDNKLNYDCIRETFIIKDNEQYIMLDAYNYSEVNVTTDDGVTNFVNVSYAGDVFFAESLYKGANADLLVKHVAKKNFTNRNNYNDVRTMYTIAKKAKYFVRIGTDIFPIAKKEKDVLRVLKNKNLKPYIKKNKLKVKKDQDLIKLIEYFDSLI